MKIHFTTRPPRRKPKVGDTKVVRGVKYVRQFARAKSGPERGALIVSSGRYRYEWVRAE